MTEISNLQIKSKLAVRKEIYIRSPFSYHLTGSLYMTIEIEKCKEKDRKTLP